MELVGLIFPLPYAWNAGFPKYVVNAESANHLVVALISAVFVFNALSSAVNGLSYLFFGLSSSVSYLIITLLALWSVPGSLESFLLCPYSYCLP